MSYAAIFPADVASWAAVAFPESSQPKWHHIEFIRKHFAHGAGCTTGFRCSFPPVHCACNLISFLVCISNIICPFTDNFWDILLNPFQNRRDVAFLPFGAPSTVQCNCKQPTSSSNSIEQEEDEQKIDTRQLGEPSLHIKYIFLSFRCAGMAWHGNAMALWRKKAGMHIIVFASAKCFWYEHFQ